MTTYIIKLNSEVNDKGSTDRIRADEWTVVPGRNTLEFYVKERNGLRAIAVYNEGSWIKFYEEDTVTEINV